MNVCGNLSVDTTKLHYYTFSVTINYLEKTSYMKMLYANELKCYKHQWKMHNIQYNYDTISSNAERPRFKNKK